MKCLILALALGASMSLPACANAGQHLDLLAATPAGSYRLGPGDELRVNVSGLDAMNATYLVDDTGAIAVPMLDPIPVTGKTVREAEAAIRDGIKARQLVLDPRVSAQVMAYRPYFIAGEVQKPGQYPYVPGMSLMTAVSVAGGYTFRANTRTATITRATAKGKATQDTPVLPGDMIMVRESWF